MDKGMVKEKNIILIKKEKKFEGEYLNGERYEKGKKEYYYIKCVKNIECSII